MASARGSGEAPVECQLCRRYREFGHLDPDNLKWYCEDCWRSFSGEQRTCFLCRRFVAKGAVDRSDKRWYCNNCWDRYVGPGSEGPPRRGGDGRAPAAFAAPPSPPRRRSREPRCSRTPRSSRSLRRSRSPRRSRSRRRSSIGGSGLGPQLPSDSWRAPPPVPASTRGDYAPPRHPGPAAAPPDVRGPFPVPAADPYRRYARAPPPREVSHSGYSGGFAGHGVGAPPSAFGAPPLRTGAPYSAPPAGHMAAHPHRQGGCPPQLGLRPPPAKYGPLPPVNHFYGSHAFAAPPIYR